MTPGEEVTVADETSLVSSRRVILLVILSMVVFALVGWYGRFDEVMTALSSIPWYFVLPAMMALSFLNYVIRYAKWQYFLRRIDVNISHSDSFAIFLAGFTLTATPG
ncbi:MAG: lysylphosphatidylglycerol synthase domain-containing protein, partial [Candidatus Thorarchaeota archaeon]